MRMLSGIEAALRRIAAAGLGAEPYAVGGAVRDRLLGLTVEEVDLVVEDAAEWAAQAGALLGVRAVRIGAGPSVWRLPLGGGHLDAAEPQGGLQADLRRRDYTVNAMAVSLTDYLAVDSAVGLADGVIDPLGGRADLEAGRLQPAAPKALDADPLRVLRGLRLEALRGLRLTGEAEAAIRRCAPLLAGAAAERIWAELEQLLLHDRSAGAVRRMEALGVLDVLIPELAACRGVEQRPPQRRGAPDVLRHQLDALGWVDELISLQRPAEPLAARLWDGLWRSDAAAAAAVSGLRGRLWELRLALRTATLLHDLGKPGTRSVDADGRTRFFGHSELGAELAAARLTALRAPRALVERVRLLVLHHLRPGQLAAPGRAPTDRALYRFHTALGELAAPLCWLFLADSLATVGGAALAPRWLAYAAHAARIMSWRRRDPPSAPRLLSGHAIMAAAGLRPGPLVGAIRAAIDEAAALGEIGTYEEARALALRLADGAAGGAAVGSAASAALDAEKGAGVA